MDANAVKPELDQELITCTKAYLVSVDGGDLDGMEKWYADDFVNVRFDKQGQAVNIPKTAFMNLLRGWAAEGGEHPMTEAQETHFIATSKYGDYASVLMLRVKGGETVSYNFVWRHTDRWLIVREFTFQDELPVPPED